MSNEEMDRAIAEYLGWRLREREVQGMNNVYWLPQGQEDYPEAVFVYCTRTPPRYSTDLNAMWRAEQALWLRDWGARDVFVDNLCRIMDPVNGHRKQSAIDILDATAEQRAQAFIETIKQIKP